MVTVVQVIPRWDSKADGVRDHALTLSRAVAARYGFDTITVVGTPTDSAGREGGRAQSARVLGVRSAGHLDEALEGVGELNADGAVWVTVHYVNYGYAKRGCPFWLIEGVRRWKQGDRRRHLLTVFHELYALGPPWKSSFWLSPMQRWLARRLAGLSDAAITSLPTYRERLVGWGMDPRRVGLYAVFSTVGELKHPNPLTERKRQLAVFGSAGLRRRLYTEGAGSLRTWLKRLGLIEIVDIGPPTGLEIERLMGVPARETGPADAAIISGTLAESHAGAVAYPPGFLGKSTVFAAYCAHGVLPLVYSGGRTGVEEVEAGREYVLMDSASVDCDNLQKVADEAHAWYQTHTVGVVADWVGSAVR